MIKKCSCEKLPDGRNAAAEFQDQKYGKGNRVHNPTIKKGPRCTVCLTLK